MHTKLCIGYKCTVQLSYHLRRANEAEGGYFTIGCKTGKFALNAGCDFLFTEILTHQHQFLFMCVIILTCVGIWCSQYGDFTFNDQSRTRYYRGPLVI